MTTQEIEQRFNSPISLDGLSLEQLTAMASDLQRQVRERGV